MSKTLIHPTISSLRKKAAQGETLVMPVRLGSLSRNAALLALAVPAQVLVHDHVPGAGSGADPHLVRVGGQSYVLSERSTAQDTVAARTAIRPGTVDGILAEQYLAMAGLAGSHTVQDAHLSTLKVWPEEVSLLPADCFSPQPRRLDRTRHAIRPKHSYAGSPPKAWSHDTFRAMAVFGRQARL